MRKHNISDHALNHLKNMITLENLSGQTIEQRYQVIDKVGEGGMGEVYLVHDQKLQREAALKVIGHRNVSAEVVERFVREIKAMAALQHPNIIAVYDSGQLEDGRLFYTMKFVRGRNFADLIYDQAPRERLLEIFAKVCRGVAFAHAQGVIHRDLKPGNILVDETGEPYVMDWGLVKVLKAMEDSTQLRKRDVQKGSATQTGIAMGTPHYMSPEQANGTRVDHLSDVYALGAILYEILLRRPPFLGDDPIDVINRLTYEQPPAPRVLDPRIPPELEAICLKAMEKLPHNRYPNAAALQRDIENFMRDEPVSIWHTTVLSRLFKRLRRYRAVLISFAVILLLLGAAGWLVKTLLRVEGRKFELSEREKLRKKAQPFLDAGRGAYETARRKLERSETYREARPLLAQAVQSLTQAIQTDPNNEESYRLRGMARFELREHDAAVEDLTRAINLNPDMGLAYFNRGIVLLHEDLLSSGRLPRIVDPVLPQSRLGLKDYVSPHQRRQRARILEDLDKGAELLKRERYSDIARIVRSLFDAKFQDAVAQLKEYEQHDNTDPLLYLLRAVACMGLNKLDEALEDLRRVQGLEQCFYEARLLESLVHLMKHERALAVACCRKAAEIYADPRVPLYRVIIYAHFGELRLALHELEQLRLASPEAQLVRAAVHADAGQPKAALEALSSVLGGDAEHASLLTAQAHLLYELGDDAGALPPLNRVLAQQTSDARLYCLRGRCHARLGDLQAADGDLSRALDLDPRYAEARFERGETRARMGKLEEAKLDLQQAIEIDPGEARYYTSLGTVFYRLGDPESARVNFTRAVRRDPMHWQAFAGRARVHLDAGELEYAISDFTEAIRIHPTESDLYVGRGSAHLRQHMYAVALRDFNEALRHRDNPLAYAYRGELYLSQGRPLDAVDDLTAAIELGNATARVYLQRGYAFFALHQYGRAQDDWARAAQLDPSLANEFEHEH